MPKRARSIATREAILALSPTLDHEQACGATPINGAAPSRAAARPRARAARPAQLGRHGGRQIARRRLRVVRLRRSGRSVADRAISAARCSRSRANAIGAALRHCRAGCRPSCRARRARRDVRDAESGWASCAAASARSSRGARSATTSRANAHRRRVPRPALSAARGARVRATLGRSVAAVAAERIDGRRRGRLAAPAAARRRRRCPRSTAHQPRDVPAAGVGNARRSRANSSRALKKKGRARRRISGRRHERFALHGDQMERAGIRRARTRTMSTLSGPLVACAGRRPHPVRPLPARLPAARGPARRLLRAPARRRRDGADDLRPLVGLLHRPDREEAAQPLLSRLERALVRHRRLQSRLQVLPELGHLEVARDGHADGRGHRRRRSPRRPRRLRLPQRRLHLQRSRSSSPSTRWTPPTPATRAASRRSPSPPATSAPSARREFYAKMDAANVDLKGFTDEFYVKLCGAHLQPVLDTLVYLKHETDVWFEITTLLIPGKNDSDAEIEAMCEVDRARARPRRAAAFHGVPSRLQDDGHAAHAGGDAHARARHRARARACTTSTPATCTTATAARRSVRTAQAG